MKHLSAIHPWSFRLLPMLLLSLSGSPVLAGSAVVGTGTPASCTEGALDSAVASANSGGGTITFACGADPVTLTLTGAKTITGFVTIDSDLLVTLSGGNATRHFVVSAGGVLTLRDIALVHGQATGGGAILAEATSEVHFFSTTITDNVSTTVGGAQQQPGRRQPGVRCGRGAASRRRPARPRDGAGARQQRRRSGRRRLDHGLQPARGDSRVVRRQRFRVGRRRARCLRLLGLHRPEPDRDEHRDRQGRRHAPRRRLGGVAQLRHDRAQQRGGGGRPLPGERHLIDSPSGHLLGQPGDRRRRARRRRGQPRNPATRKQHGLRQQCRRLGRRRVFGGLDDPALRHHRMEPGGRRRRSRPSSG